MNDDRSMFLIQSDYWLWWYSLDLPLMRLATSTIAECQRYLFFLFSSTVCLVGLIGLYGEMMGSGSLHLRRCSTGNFLPIAISLLYDQC